MLNFVKAFNIWDLPVESLAAIVRPGQWVYAGDRDSMGRFLGVKRNGIVVVAWRENARRYPDGKKAYYRQLRNYALGR
jgi:hypothetical protein